MRLLNVNTFKFTDFSLKTERPKYIIASHRWCKDEITDRDVRDGRNRETDGYKKVEAFVRFVKINIPTIEWLWIDTCCIDKDASAELRYAVNSMFSWYRISEMCIAYLADVDSGDDPVLCTRSEWFDRGWTLQELLAPRVVIFVSRDWEIIGNKGATYHGFMTAAGFDLSTTIANERGLPGAILKDLARLLEISTSEKVEWMSRRRTTRPEDKWYALFGLVGITPGANYGENAAGAKERFYAALKRREPSPVRDYDDILKWLSPPDAWINHQYALDNSVRYSGKWFLRTREYQAWKNGQDRVLWIHRAAEYGKITICSIVIQEIRALTREEAHVGHLVFYFDYLKSPRQSVIEITTSISCAAGIRHELSSIAHKSQA